MSFIQLKTEIFVTLYKRKKFKEVLDKKATNTKFIFDKFEVVTSVSPHAEREESFCNNHATGSKPFTGASGTVKGLKVFIINYAGKELQFFDDFKEFKESVERVLLEFNKINTLGYVKEDTVFPIVDGFINHFTLNYREVGEKAKALSLRSRRWVYNLILLSMYHSTLKTIGELKPKIAPQSVSSLFQKSQDPYEDEESDFPREKTDDLLTDLKILLKSVHSSLDPSLKHSLQNQGFSISKNVYVGYDTEYMLKDYVRKENKLVSYQLALNNRVFLKIPLSIKFCLGVRDPKTGVFRKEKADGVFVKQVEASLESQCVGIRQCYSNSDEFKKDLIKYLKSESVDCFHKKDSVTFGFKRSDVVSFIGYNDVEDRGVSFDNLLKKIVELDPSTELTQLRKFFEEKGVKFPNIRFYKRMSRTTFFYKGEKTNVTLNKSVYINAHLSKADLSILNDFSKLKVQLSLVNKEFVTVKPLVYSGFSLHLRDTMLLTPASSRSLAAIGAMYGEGFEKVVIPSRYYEDMGTFLKEDKELFDKYALRDAVITLKHVNELEDFCFKAINNIGVPLTLSSIGKRYVFKHWEETDYTYQVTGDTNLGNPGSVFTPKGLDATKSIGLYLPYFIANYKGGRNESFMYGVDKTTKWYDYDLTSAYTTSMAFLGDPDYLKIRFLDESEVLRLSRLEMLRSYIIIKGQFSFPEGVKFPSIPCYVDKTTTVYPREGEAYLTGLEYITGLDQGCEFKISSGVIIPFKLKCPVEELPSSEVKLRQKFKTPPFFDIMKTVQSLRRKYPKGSLSNNMWKTIGNSIYGNVVSGMANKKVFDIKTGEMRRIEASVLTNPILASYTTAFTRCLVGECLHNISRLGGRVVSVTTDGFLTDVANLEEKILALSEGNTFIKIFRSLRGEIEGSPEFLDVKSPSVESSAPEVDSVSLIDKSEARVEESEEPESNVESFENRPPGLFKEILTEGWRDFAASIGLEIAEENPGPLSKSNKFVEGSKGVSPEAVGLKELSPETKELKEVSFGVSPGVSLEVSSGLSPEVSLVSSSSSPASSWSSSSSSGLSAESPPIASPALELKKTCRGIISWTTRGQLAVEGGIKATTGFQSAGVKHETMVSDFMRVMSSPDKSLVYIQTLLRGSKEIYLHGGHTIMKYQDQTFRLKYDNRRLIENPKEISGERGLLDSVPVKDKKVCLNLRELSGMTGKLYDKWTYAPSKSLYKHEVETAVRVFIRGYLASECEYGLKKSDFKGYLEIITFIKRFCPDLRISKQSISNLKHRKSVSKTVPRLRVNEEFVGYVKTYLPHFREFEFLKGD